MKRAPAWLILSIAGVSSLALGQSLSARAEPVSPDPITIEGAGDSDHVRELVDWQNTLFSSTQPVDMQYFDRGTKEARGELLRGEADFALSGVPFTAAELAARASDAGKIIELPISVGAASIVFSRPFGPGWDTQRLRTEDPRCDPLSPDFDESVCYEYGTYTGSIKLPGESVAAYALGLTPSFRQNNLVAWNSPGIEAAMGVSTLKIQIRDGLSHTFLERTEASAESKYLQVYARAMGPTAWALRKQENPQFDWDAMQEVFSPRTLSRYGLDTQLGLMGLPGDPRGIAADTWTGNAGPVPLTYTQTFIERFPNSVFQVAAIENKNGDFVLPTTETITNAINASIEPDFAASNPVPDAYPLVWVNRLYTVSGTLSHDKANALAAAVRYLVTDGQASVVDHGGAALPSALVDQALEKANEIVVANCTEEGYIVESGGPSQFETSTPNVQALTGLDHCVLAPPPTTTTSASTTSTSTTTSTTTTTAPSTSVVEQTTTSSAASTQTEPTDGTLSTEVLSEPSPAYVPPPYTPPSPVYSPPSASSGSSPQPPNTEPPATTTTADPTSTVPAISEATTTTISLAVGGGGTRPQARGRPLKSLVLPLPSNGAGGFKKLGTLLLGAALYLATRRIVQARRAAA